MNGLHTFNSPLTRSRDVSPSPGLLTPIPNGVRRISGDVSSSPTRQSMSGPVPLPSPNMLSPSSPAGEKESPGWSSAIGHATTAGKSGRVIEKLMAENDRLKRELELQVLRVQELERNAQTYRPQIEALREKVDSLSHASTMDSSLISRRDRRIEELKADNASLKDDRENMQKKMRDTERQRDEAVDQSKREVLSLVESTKHATVHAEILETSHRQLSAEYRARREKWNHDLSNLHEEREKDAKRIAILDVVCDQMRQEAERTRRLQADLVAKWEGHEMALRATEREADAESDRFRQKTHEMNQVVDQMRWLMGMHKVQEKKKAERPDSPRDSTQPI